MGCPLDYGYETGDDEAERARPAPAPERARGFPFVDSGRDPAKATAVLGTWSVLEALSPRAYSDPRDLIDETHELWRMEPGDIPWPDHEPPREHYAFYYRFDLGGIDLRKVSQAILDAYGWDEGTIGVRGSRAMMGMGLVDARGAPVGKGFSVSSFGWALPLVLGKSLGRMQRWGEVEQDVLANLMNRLTSQDPDQPDRLAALRWEDVLGAHEWLVKRFGIPAEYVIPPEFSLRFQYRSRSGSVPGPYLMNSFYLGDIDRAIGLVENGEAPQALRAYLGLDRPARPMDVLRTKGALRHLLAPERTPEARWPSPGGHPLVTLQQAATNAAVAGLGGTEGLLSVNGPPGTGKTTLLRDVVAAAAVRRATAMAAFDDPEDAFVRGEGESRRVYWLDASLMGHEVLVASSNNKAVENISRELPLMRSVEGGPDGEAAPRHFRATADFVAGNVRPNGDLADPDRACWGLGAAVMGNAGNRAAFMERFWWNEDYGIRTCLRLAKGEDVKVAIVEKKQIVGNRPPHLLRTETPPRGRAAARQRWAEVRARFRTRREAIMLELDLLSAYERAMTGREALADAVARAEAALSALERAARPVDALALRHAKAEDDLDALLGMGERHRALEPRHPTLGGGRAAWDIWDAEREEIEHRLQGAARTLARLQAALADERAAAGDAADDGGVLAARRDLEESRASLVDALSVIEAVRAKGAPLRVDEAFFEAGHAEWNKASPWLSRELQALRSELFACAMEVHEAFAYAAAGRLLKNLSAYSEMTGSGGPSPELVPYAADLWASLFMVVPVVSTTFASAGRMLNALAPASLGWLVIDEAGQAVPQAAVGAITRFQRVIAVGDPLQVEPVVTLPRRLAARICDHFDVDVEACVAPTASVQTLADAASPLKATYDTIDGDREVGMPLLVHRRCREPMFGISNRIAYAGQMVPAAPEGPLGPASARIGESAWFDVTGLHEGKWCYAQGDAVAALLARASRGADGQPVPGGPDVYVISPFRLVAQKLRTRILAETGLFPGMDARAWIESHVGTIHTFQGREAEAVIVVLGAGESDHDGARTWAGRTPNIANVAVTRARHALYVVGARLAWEGAGAFSAVAEALPVLPLPKAPIGVLRAAAQPVAKPSGPAPRQLRAQGPVTVSAAAAALAELDAEAELAAHADPEDVRERLDAESEARLLASIDNFEDLARLGP